MHLANSFDCCGCSACAEICPQYCITMLPDNEGFLYPKVDVQECVFCGKCQNVCPIINTHLSVDPAQLLVSYAAINKNESIRATSSSGGIFTLLSEAIIEQGGVVFGAAMQKDQHTLVHIGVKDKEGLGKLRGSKYLQSNTTGVYSQVEQALCAGNKVLFSGTPCQVEALQSFLGKEYDDLFCVDLICHGVPSPKVWSKYVTYREICAGASVQRTFFRDKKYGWKMFAVSFEFQNDTAYKQIHSMDLFMQAFLQNACIRPSCHACKFKGINRNSDITLADFWGVQNIAPEMDDNGGTSLVLIHTSKGQQAFDSLKDEMYFLQVDTTQALIGNPSATASVAMGRHRKDFFEKLDELPFDALVHRYVKPRKGFIKKAVVIFTKKLGIYSFAKKIYTLLRSA